jgi:cytochrome c
MLFAGMIYAVLYVTMSFALEGSLSTREVDLNPTSVFGRSELGGGTARACTGCHVLNQMENGVGPHLVDVVDRRAGAVAGFQYSNAMRKADMHWTRGRLREFLRDPQAVVPGTDMPAIRLDEDAAEAIVNYLSRQH